MNRASDPAPPAVNRREVGVIFTYISLLGVLLTLGTISNVADSSSLAYYPILFFLKNNLKLDEVQTSVFTALLAIPTYIGFVFGLLRDRWRPLGRGDRGYFLLVAPVVAACYLLLAKFAVSYALLLTLALLTSVLGALLGAAYGGLTAALAQRDYMTGRLGALISAVSYSPAILAALAGGWLSENAPPSTTFLICVGLMLCVTAFGFWRPLAVFRHDVTVPVIEESIPVAVGRLFKHRPFIPAAILMCLWQIMPGWGTPLVYHLSDTLKLSETQVGVVQATYPFFMAASSLVYLLLCGRYRLGPLLWITMVLGVIVAPSALLMRDYKSAIAVQAMVGIVWGLGNAALYDLMLRSYPKNLYGTGAMVMAGIYSGAYMLSDIGGSWLYKHGSFGIAMLVTTITSCFMLPVLLWVPKAIMQARDGEAPVEKTAQWPVGVGATSG